MARTGGLSFSSLIDIQIVLLLLRISIEASVFRAGGCLGCLGFVPETSLELFQIR